LRIAHAPADERTYESARDHVSEPAAKRHILVEHADTQDQLRRLPAEFFGNGHDIANEVLTVRIRRHNADRIGMMREDVVYPRPQSGSLAEVDGMPQNPGAGIAL
jgi:hypothetical protein